MPWFRRSLPTFLRNDYVAWSTGVPKEEGTGKWNPLCHLFQRSSMLCLMFYNLAVPNSKLRKFCNSRAIFEKYYSGNCVQAYVVLLRTWHCFSFRNKTIQLVWWLEWHFTMHQNLNTLAPWHLQPRTKPATRRSVSQLTTNRTAQVSDHRMTQFFSVLGF